MGAASDAIVRGLQCVLFNFFVVLQMFLFTLCTVFSMYLWGSFVGGVCSYYLFGRGGDVWGGVCVRV